MPDPSTIAWLDQDDAWMVDLVRKHGWAIQYVGGRGCSRPGCTCQSDQASDRPAFAYTVGLFGLGHPELLVLGMPQETTGALLNELGRRVRDGETLLPGQLLTFAEWQHRVVPEPVPNAGEIVFGANRYYKRPPRYSVEVLQLSYDDLQGRFPWEEGYSHPHLQPRPGTFRA